MENRNRSLWAGALQSVCFAGMVGISIFGVPRGPSLAQSDSLAPRPPVEAEPAQSETSELTQPAPDNRQAVTEHVRLGDRKYAEAEYDEAIEAYTQALNLYRLNAYALYHRGNAYRKQKNYQAAIADYTLAIRLNPDNTFGFLYRGMTQQKLGALEAAIADYTVCIDRNDKKPLWFHLRGEARHGLGQHDLAIDDLEKAAQLYESEKKYRQQSQVNRLLKKVKAAR